MIEDIEPEPVHKCINPYEVQRRLRQWEQDQTRKWGKGWEFNLNRPVSIIHDYPPPQGVNVIISGSKTRDDSISLKEWLKRREEKRQTDKQSLNNNL